MRVPPPKLILVCVVLLFFGCAQHQAATRSPGVNLSGFSAEFKAGYTDGCASVGGSRTRDDERFKSDMRYARGWQDGYAICKK